MASPIPARHHGPTPAEWFAGFGGKCCKCGIAIADVSVPTCPVCGSLETQYNAGRALSMALAPRPAPGSPAPTRTPTPATPRAVVDPLSFTSSDGRIIVTLTRLPKKQNPVVTVRHDGVVVVTDECAITRAPARLTLAEHCGAALFDVVQPALVALCGAWLAHLSASAVDGKGAPPSRLTQDITPWPEPVEPAAVLDAVVRQVRRHVALPAHGDIVLALWLVHTHFIESLRFTPYLWLTSPTKQCGKTTVLELCELLSLRPWRLSNPTGAAMFRVIQEERPTLLLDEIDTVSGPRLEDLTGILNDGFQAGGKVARCVGDNHDVKTFSVFSAKALAGIGTTLQDATRSRCIRLPMARATGDALAGLTTLRTDRAEQWASPLRAQIARLSDDTRAQLADAMQDDTAVPMPTGIDGRDAQCWEPLLAIADLGGPAWAADARAACVALVTARRVEDDGDVRVRLLRNVRAYFTEHRTDAATSKALIAWLVEDESRGWAEYRGRELTPESLARLLKPFTVAPVKRREGSDTARVWLRSSLDPVWAKYLEPLTPLQPATPATPATLATESPLAVPGVPGVPGFSNGSGASFFGTDDGYLTALLGDEAAIMAEDLFE